MHTHKHARIYKHNYNVWDVNCKRPLSNSGNAKIVMQSSASSFTPHDKFIYNNQVVKNEIENYHRIVISHFKFILLDPYSCYACYYLMVFSRCNMHISGGMDGSDL